jgi:hypothetical protein
VSAPEPTVPKADALPRSSASRVPVIDAATLAGRVPE